MHSPSPSLESKQGLYCEAIRLHCHGGEIRSRCVALAGLALLVS